MQSEPQSRLRADSANLDVLRAFAVLYVVAGHTMGFFRVTQLGPIPVPWIGRLGVLFFFVHTCLVLMRSLERSEAKMPPKLLALHFYIRRAFRIYPLSIIFVLAVVALKLTDYKTITALPEPYNPTLGQVISNIFLTQNLTFTHPVMGVLWSLPLEVQMYIFLPPLFLFVTRFPSVWPLLALWAISIPIALLQPFYIARASLAQFVPHFLPGVMAYCIGRQVKPNIAHFWWMPAIAVISFLFLLHANLQTGWVACLILGLSIPFFQEIPKGWIRRFSGWVAKYSYGLYLCHTVCLWGAFSALAFTPMVIQIAVYLVTLVTGPVLLYHYIEHPMINFGVRLANRLRTDKRVTVQSAAA